MKNSKECLKCGGKGVLFMHLNIKNGVCFSCNGTGIAHKLSRKKVVAEYWRVKCELEEYIYDTRFNSFDDAELFANQVKEMHLAPVSVCKVKGFTYEFKRVSA